MTRRSRGRRVGSAPAAVVISAVAAAAVLTACAGAPAGPHPGAPSHPAHAGPSVVAASALPPLAARQVSTDAPSQHHASSVAEVELQRLSNRIDAALSGPDRITPATRLSQKAAADDQILVRWTVGQDLPDPGARLRVRTDIITILRLVKASPLHYGSVLCLALGAISAHGKKSFSVVVRAKYTKRVMGRTDWSHVAPRMILRMPDDKPAVIAPGYR